MAIDVRSASDSAQRWVDRASTAGAEYESRAVAAANRWSTNAGNAQATWRAGVTGAGVDARYRSGITRAGAAKYSRKVTSVGSSRYAPGVTAAQQDYTDRITPYLALVAGLTLPARQPRGSAANIERVRMIANALSARRLGTVTT